MNVEMTTLVDSLALLPEQHAATARLLALLDDPDVDARDVVPVIEADPAMTARLMTLANSAFFGVRAKASNPWSAVMIVGFNVVRALAAAGTLGVRADNASMPPGFFDHAIGAAAGASVVARHRGQRASDAFSAGLLHDIGAGLLYRSFPTRWNRLAVPGTVPTLEAEREEFGTTHDTVGGEVLGYLHFPDALAMAVARHNRDTGPDASLATTVVAGIALAEGLGIVGCTQPIRGGARALHDAGIDPADTAALSSATTAEMATLRGVLA